MNSALKEETMIRPSRADSEEFCVLAKTKLCRHTLCISKRFGKVRAQNTRKMPRTVGSAFSQKLEETIHVSSMSPKLMTSPA